MQIFFDPKMQFNTPRITLARAMGDFGNVLGNVMIEETTVKNVLRAMGVDVTVGNIYRDDLTQGVTIAPNALRRMSRDEAYFQEIKREAHDWFFVQVPAFEKAERARVGCRGNDIRIISGMSVDEHGNVVKWVVALWNDTYDGKSEPLGGRVERVHARNNSHTPFVYDFTTDATKFAALFGNVHQQSKKT